MRIRPSVAGFCYWYLIEHDSVTYWPTVDLTTGKINEKLLSPSSWKKIEVHGTLRFQDKDADPGAYTVTEAIGAFRAPSPDLTLQSYLLRSRRWVIVCKERNGTLWMIGDAISGAAVLCTYDSNDSTRTLTLSFTWESENGPGIYNPMPTAPGDFDTTDFSPKDFF
jgi:hypothetical protein